MAEQQDVIDIIHEQKDDILILRLKGRLDAVTSPEAEKKVFDFIDKGNHNILFNLGEVNYISSAGLRMLLSTSKKLNNIPGNLFLCSLQDNVLEILKLSGFDRILEYTETEEDALERMHRE